MADGNNIQEKIAPQAAKKRPAAGNAEQLAQALTQGSEMVSAAISAFTDLTNALVAKAAEAVEEQAKRVEKSHIEKEHTVEVETTDKILNGAMNNSRFDIKVSLAEGLLNGLFCGSLLTVNIYNYGANQPPVAPEAGKQEEV